MIAMPPSPTDSAPPSAPLSRSPSRRGRSQTLSPRSQSPGRSSPAVVIRPSRSSSRSSSPSWQLASRSSISPSIPSTHGIAPPPIAGYVPSSCYPPSPPIYPRFGSQGPVIPTVVVPPSRSLSSSPIRSRSVSRSRPRPRRVVNSPSPTTSRSRSLSPPPFPMPSVAIPCPSSVKYGWSEFPPRPFIPHPRFYFRDGNVNLEINGTQYKIHRHFLVTNSSVFAHELPFNIIFKSLPCDVDQQAFELVLSLFYPKDCFSGHDIQSESDWHRVLVFACRYKMILIRDMAITKVPSLDPIVKAELAAKYGLKDWLVPVYTDLCIKDLTTRKGWSAEEGKRIGLEGILALVEVKRDLVDRLGEYLDREKVMKAVEEKLEELNLI